MSRPGEFELIERYFAPVSASGSFNLVDDAALVTLSPGCQLVVTQDAVAAGVHFFAEDPPDTVARKALRVNLSDLAAKGARPIGFSMALGLADDWTEAWIAAFSAGLAADCAAYGVSLIGGDTFRSPGGTTIAITACGEIDPELYTSRLDAEPGDWLFVTGTIGEAALGLRLLRKDMTCTDPQLAAHLVDRYRVPSPPLELAPVIAELATAAIDISDGFVGDVAKLAAASGVDFSIRVEDVPLTGGVGCVSGAGDPRELALTGGDDYQIAFTVPAGRLDRLHAMAAAAGIRISPLATAEPGRGRVTLTHRGSAVAPPSAAFTHF